MEKLYTVTDLCLDIDKILFQWVDKNRNKINTISCICPHCFSKIEIRIPQSEFSQKRLSACYDCKQEIVINFNASISINANCELKRVI